MVAGAVVATVACRCVSVLLDDGQSAIASNVAWIGADEVVLWQQVVVALVVAPLVETTLLAWPLALLRNARVRPWLAIGLVASAFALVHELGDSLSGVQVLPAFVVYGWAFLRRTSPPRDDGFGVVAAMHALYNAIPTIGILGCRYL